MHMVAIRDELGWPERVDAWLRGRRTGGEGRGGSGTVLTAHIVAVAASLLPLYVSTLCGSLHRDTNRAFWHPSVVQYDGRRDGHCERPSRLAVANRLAPSR